MTDLLPAALARQVGERGEISIRSARPTDAGVLRRLATLADRPVPVEPVLLAETDGAVLVALSTATGDVLSDPFHTTGDLVALLRLRSAQLQRLAA
jgi:hypothetical protein